MVLISQNDGITKKKYDRIVFLFQQTNLIALVSHSGSGSNQVKVNDTSITHDGIS